jgi:hypothetical protein
MIVAVLAFAAAAFAPEVSGPPADPPTNGGDGFIYMHPSRAALDLAYEREAKALRDEMHALQKSDGGKLTAEHRAALHERLAALVTAYERDLQQDDPFRRSADGRLQR